MQPAVSNALVIALWLNAEAEADNMRLQPMKLQYLLYLAQTLYALETNGEMLMPSTFVAYSDGPREPTLYAVMGELSYFSNPMPPPSKVISFLMKFWAKFSQRTGKDLLLDIRSHQPFQTALNLGEGTVVAFEAIVEHTQTRKLKSTVIASNGKAFTKWTPQRHQAAKVSNSN